MSLIPTLTIIGVASNNFEQRVLVVMDPAGQVWETGVIPLHVRPIGEQLDMRHGETTEDCLRRHGGQWVRRSAVDYSV